jgi:hypothetical protein
MPDLKAAKGRGIRQGRFVVFPDVTAKLALEDRIKKVADFVFFARSLKLDPAVGQIAHRPGYVEALGDVPNRPAKPHALNIAFVKDLHGCAHASED